MNDRQIDALQLLRRTREDGIDPSDDDLARGLARLEQEIAASGEPRTAPTGTPAPRRRRRRRAALLAGAGIIAAGAFAGVTLVLTPSPVLGPIAAPDPHAQAVAMLERAADEALGAGAELQAGQFLRVGIRSEGISSQWDARTMGRGAPVALVRSVTDTAWYYRPTRTGVRSRATRDRTVTRWCIPRETPNPSARCATKLQPRTRPSPQTRRRPRSRSTSGTPQTWRLGTRYPPTRQSCGSPSRNRPE